ncbi:hypothetical protein A3762_10350 [Oleiphilus sp. HI0125]|uniref:DUF1295 domain-containing protein n=1 Tax=Oleiphilus sp. HI0125 TaxID=1822266 RepID=UPI0007C2CC81|nr:DUF1295 domain-containing protein [Oleiphilus sp. HI0125]KZZ57112.1 hypothetical protein A3762_10350 [Oleiphilus sp. HI0125]
MAVGLNLLFFAFLAVILGTSQSNLYDMLVSNAIAQGVLFFCVVVIPFLITRRMSFVDIAWPFGVALIGAHILMMGDADPVRQTVVGAVYLFIGLRMGLGALTMAKTTGVIFKYEFPRYDYRRTMLDQSGSKFTNAHMLGEAVAQGFANMTVLAVPGFLIATSSIEGISVWEYVGLGLWGLAYLCESVADGQKMYFISKNPKGVCNIGLWKYSRHPNYFSEWLVWTGIVVATLPSWLAIQSVETPLVWISLGICALFASVMLYITLVYLTGAKPAEYYSVQRRAGYKEYQETTNMFFPWFPKNR